MIICQKFQIHLHSIFSTNMDKYNNEQFFVTREELIIFISLAFLCGFTLAVIMANLGFDFTVTSGDPSHRKTVRATIRTVLSTTLVLALLRN